MRIYSMTATFGKLEHETLTLEPGLNIIQAPNEWGKSTWCAFLMAMLYGVDTRAKSTKTALADKEHYVPWSGSPMSGSISLNWNGRDITIQRHTRGRIPLGEFRAFETSSGMEIPELTAANCGEVLLGVERSVFARTGFLKFSDLPVTQDENLRRRLNALVTTGDESGCGELLGQKLRELKNRCRYHRSGLLPQAELQRQELENKLREHDAFAGQREKLLRRQAELEAHIRRLENHKTALRYAAVRADEEKVLAALEARDRAGELLQELEEQTRTLPSRQEAEEALQNLNRLRENRDSIQMEEQMLPPLPQPPEPPEVFRGCSGQQAVLQAQEHRKELASLQPKKNGLGALLLAMGGVFAAAGMILLVLKHLILGIPALALGIGGLIPGFLLRKQYARHLARYQDRKAALSRRYGSGEPDEWVASAKAYADACQDYQRRNSACRRLRGDLDSRREALLQTLAGLSGGGSLSDAMAHWNSVLTFWDAYADAFRNHRQAQHHLEVLQSMAKTAHPPEEPDELTCTEAETNALLLSASNELRQLHVSLGQCQGRSDALGSNEELVRELEAVNRRIQELELTCTALELAQEALEKATGELQRRFAPRIAHRARELFSRLTGGRYDRLTLAEDLSLHAGAVGEDILRSQQWRSDGTIDQLYLALRLAAARELTPVAPLILDDALIRFDDDRLAAALDLLRREAEHKQVILFTCQSREKELTK